MESSCIINFGAIEQEDLIREEDEGDISYSSFQAIANGHRETRREVFYRIIVVNFGGNGDPLVGIVDSQFYISYDIN